MKFQEYIPYGFQWLEYNTDGTAILLTHHGKSSIKFEKVPPINFFRLNLYFIIFNDVIHFYEFTVSFYSSEYLATAKFI